MIPARYDHIPAGTPLQGIQEIIVHVECGIARRGSIENIAGDKKQFDFAFPDRLGKPFQESGKLLIAASAVEGVTDMPVGCMEYLHSARSRISCHRAAEASEGMRQSPRGERLTEPTFGPSGSQFRLNC